VQGNTATSTLPLLRERLPVLSPATRPGKVEVVVQEAATQQPLIWQSPSSFVYQFNWTLAAYSGCAMACTYCYVPDVIRNLPDKLGGWGNYVHVRSRCVELLTRQLDQLAGTAGFMSATTDPYQKVEGEYRLTRRLLETLVDSKMGFLLISTRGTLVLRDLDIFTDPRMKGRIEIGVSIPSNLNLAHAALEASTPAFKGRFAVARKLRDAGVPVRIHAAPLVLHTSDFYEMVADCADWLWIDYTQHGAGKHPETSCWYYSRDEVQSLAERAAQIPSLGAARTGFGRDRFGWRWDGAERRIVAPPPRVQNPAEKRKGEPRG
jgi:DNA repair photolyase